MLFSKMSKCPYCSAEMKVSPEDVFVVCEYCGREMEVPRFTQEEKRLTQAVEEMRLSTENAEAALKEATRRAEESDAQMEARIAALAEQQAADSVRARMHRDEVIAELRSEAVRQREEAKAHLHELKSEQSRLSNQFDAMQKEQQAGKAASLQHCYELGENAQRAGRFDEAIKHFQELLVMSEEQEAEVHWRIVLCRYGVEYVREQSSETFLPTITHMIVDSIEDDADYLAAERYARSERMRSYYEEEARRIDDILDKYREVYGQERPYDVFISVKQGDDKGRPTEDSMVAMDLYYMLTGMGLHVFNSRISLQEHAGLEYEPYIMAALMTSKAMLVVGTRSDYMNSPWVRNEWRRFRWLQENGKESRRLIAYIVGMKTGEIPKEMGALQIINAQTSGDPKGQLRRIVEKDFGNRGSRKNESRDDEKKRLRRAELLLEEGDVGKCEEYIEQALEDNPEAGMAYALKLCIAKGVNRIDKLGRLTAPIADDLNFRRAMSFGDEKLKQRLTEVAQAVQENIRAEEARKAAEERARREREAAEKAEQERLAAEKARREREEAERKERERLELRERMEREIREKVEAERKEHERRELELMLNMLDEAGGNGKKPDADLPKQEDADAKKLTYEDRLRQRRQEEKQEEARKAREEAEKREREAREKALAEAAKKAEEERLAADKVRREREYQESIAKGQAKSKKRKKRILTVVATIAVVLGAVVVFRVPILDHLAMNGSARAMLDRAYAYDGGTPLAYQDDEKAIEWYHRAAKAGSGSANVMLSNYYARGTMGLEKDFYSATYHIIRAGELGNDGSWALKDYMAEIEAEGKNHSGIANNLSVMYQNGWGVTQDLEKAAQWMTQADVLKYEEEQAVFKNMAQEAIEPYVQAVESADVLADLQSGAYMERANQLAAAGEDDALYGYGVQLYSIASGMATYEAEDAYSAAAYVFNAAKELDVPGAQDMYKMVMYELGMCYLSYEEIRSADAAFDCFSTAAEYFHAGSIYMLGHMYEGGDLGTEDFELAFRCYAQAARIGYAQAITACEERGINYREILDYGDVFGRQAVVETAPQASRELSLADHEALVDGLYRGNDAASLFATGMEFYNLGANHYEVVQIYMMSAAKLYSQQGEANYDPDKARQAYAIAAEMGNGKGQYQMGIFCNAEGDTEGAIEWYRKAFANGYGEYDESLYEKCAYDELKLGDNSVQVKRIQKQLIDLGYLTGEADGMFGEQTLKAVADFAQAANIYSYSGAVDEALQIAIYRAAANPVSPLRRK